MDARFPVPTAEATATLTSFLKRSLYCRRKIQEQMEAVGNLLSFGRAPGSGLSVGTRPVAGDHRNAGMLF
jgi:hypothetical protein